MTESVETGVTPHPVVEDTTQNQVMTEGDRLATQDVVVEAPNGVLVTFKHQDMVEISGWGVVATVPGVYKKVTGQ